MTRVCLGQDIPRLSSLFVANLTLLLLSCALGSNVASAQQTFAHGLIHATTQELKSATKAERTLGGFLPGSYDLSAHGAFPPPGQQGHQSSCAAWALAYALMSYDVWDERRWALENKGMVVPEHVFSPSFIYNQLNHRHDGGIKFTEALSLLRQQGVPPLPDMPYRERDYTTQPGATAKRDAQAYKITGYEAVNTTSLVEVKSQLYAGFPVLAGLDVDSSLDTLSKNANYKKYESTKLSGHGIVIVGYDDKRSAFKFINSWGPTWSDGGYGWIDYTFFSKIAFEGWKITESETVASTASTPPPDEATLTGDQSTSQAFSGLPALSGGSLRVVVAHSNLYHGYVLYISYFGQGKLDASVSLNSPCENVRCPEPLVLRRVVYGLPASSTQQEKDSLSLMPVIYVEKGASQVSFHWTIRIRPSI